jgi:hypothetical protein
MALLPLRWCRVLRDVHVPRIERLDQALQSPALPGGVPAFEEDRERWTEPPFIARQFSAESQPERGESRLRGVEPLLVLALRERQTEVQLV